MRWWRLAAAQEDADAQFILDNMFNNGEGLAEDHAEAVRWYRLAAAQGHVCAGQVETTWRLKRTSPPPLSSSAYIPIPSADPPVEYNYFCRERAIAAADALLLRNRISFQKSSLSFPSVKRKVTVTWNWPFQKSSSRVPGVYCRSSLCISKQIAVHVLFQSEKTNLSNATNSTQLISHMNQVQHCGRRRFNDYRLPQQAQRLQQRSSLRA